MHDKFNSPIHAPFSLPRVASVDRDDWILTKSKGHRVLHLGATDAPLTASKSHNGRLLHQKLRSIDCDLTGVDYAADEIDFLRLNYGIDDIQLANAENLSAIFPDQKFSLIIAGDIIEHVDNVGHFIDSILGVLEDDGVLLVTTPNAFSFKKFLGVLAFRQERNHPDHLYFFSMMNFRQLAFRHNLEIVEVSTFLIKDKSRAVNRLSGFVSRIVQTLSCNNWVADELAIAFKKN